MMNKEKIEKIVEVVKKYVVSKIGEGEVWEWMLCERYDWNGGGLNLKLQTWTEHKTLDVITFRKSVWGIGWYRDGSIAWKFKYTNKDIDGLLENKKFIEGLNIHVLQYIKKKKS